MTNLYSSNFDSDTSGQIAPGWTAINGTWQVGTVSPISGAQSFGETTNTNGTVALYTGVAARADSIISLTQKIPQVTIGASYFIAFRGAADWSTGYLFALEYSGGLQFAFYKRSAGSYTKVSSASAAGLGLAGGDNVAMEAKIVGTSFEFRVWKVGASRPSSPSFSASDSTFTSGYAGLYRANTNSTPLAVDDFVLDDAATVTPATALTLSLSSASAVVGTSVTATIGTNGTLSGSDSESVTLTAPVAGTWSVNPVTLNASTQSTTSTFTASAAGSGNITAAATGTPTLTGASTAYTATAAATVPGAPTIGTAIAGDGYVDVYFTAPASNGGSAITGYTATLSTGESNTGTSSPIRVTAANGTARTAHVTATNSVGTGAASAESNSVTPVSAPTFPVTNANIYFSPYNWYSDGAGAMQANNVKGSSTFAWSNMRGAYLKFKATVGAAGTISLGINTATLSAISAAGCPQIAWSINGAAIQSKTLATGDTSISLTTGLAAGTYEVFVWFRGVYITQDGSVAQNYTTPNNRFQVTGITLSAGGTLSAPTVRSKKMASYGDSITEGDLSNGGPRSATSQDASLTYAWLLAEALDAEVGIIGFYGQQWSWLNSTWSNYASGLSRLVGGLLTPAPDYITVNYGENDGNGGAAGPASSTVAATLAAIAAAAPSSKLIHLIPFSGRCRANMSAATLPANGYRIDLARYEMLGGNTVWSYDGQHPNQRGHANLAALLAYQVQNIVPATTARTVTLTLKDANGPVANLTGAKVAVFDESTPDQRTAPRYKSSAQTTDANGVMAITYQSTLPVGGSCGVSVEMADGRNCDVVATVA